MLISHKAIICFINTSKRIKDELQKQGFYNINGDEIVLKLYLNNSKQTIIYVDVTDVINEKYDKPKNIYKHVFLNPIYTKLMYREINVCKSKESVFGWELMDPNELLTLL